MINTNIKHIYLNIICIGYKHTKPNSYRRIAIWETWVSQTAQNKSQKGVSWGPIKAPFKLFQHHGNMLQRGLSGCPQLPPCRKASASQAPDAFFCSTATYQYTFVLSFANTIQIILSVHSCTVQKFSKF